MSDKSLKYLFFFQNKNAKCIFGSGFSVVRICWFSQWKCKNFEVGTVGQTNTQNVEIFQFVSSKNGALFEKKKNNSWS